MTRLNQVVVSSEILEKSWTNGMDESSSQDHLQKSDDPLYLALYQISRAAHTEQSLDDLYASIHGIVSRLMPAQNFYISLYDQLLILYPSRTGWINMIPALNHAKGNAEKQNMS